MKNQSFVLYQNIEGVTHYYQAILAGYLIAKNPDISNAVVFNSLWEAEQKVSKLYNELGETFYIKIISI